MKNYCKVLLVLLVMGFGSAVAEEIEVIDVVEEAGHTASLPALKPVHAGLMGTAALLLLVSMLIARRRRKDNSWLGKHKALGVVGPLLLAVGVGVAYAMVDSFGGDHFSVPHTWVGIAGVGLTLIMPLLGFSIFWMPERSSAIRPVHVWIGRITLLILLTAGVSGILM
jgi:hypothetical protein